MTCRVVSATLEVVSRHLLSVVICLLYSRYDVIGTTPFYGPFPGPQGEPVPEENFWTLSCKGRLTEADTPTIRLGATPSTLTNAHLYHPPFFYRSDAFPAAQPTVSKH